MPLFPFTPKGVEDKLNELYALTDSALAIQAGSISSNFRLWISNAFILSPDQQNYLTAMDEDAVDYFGQQCSFCFRNRLEIRLIYPDPPVSPGYSKWIAASNTIAVDADDEEESDVTGSLTFTINYKS
jgi:hypothetical protein